LPATIIEVSKQLEYYAKNETVTFGGPVTVSENWVYRKPGKK